MATHSQVTPHVFAPLRWPPSGAAGEGAAGRGAGGAAFNREAVAAAARDEGFRGGYEEGLRRAASEQRATTARLQSIVDGASTDARDLIHDLERAVVELSLAVAARVVERELRADRWLVEAVIRAALGEVEAATIVRVRVHPDDAALLAERWQELQPNPPGDHLQLQSDERVRPGGCIVETRLGQVDAQLETKLAQIATTFEAIREGEPA